VTLKCTIRSIGQPDWVRAKPALRATARQTLRQTPGDCRHSNTGRRSRRARILFGIGRPEADRSLHEGTFKAPQRGHDRVGASQIPTKHIGLVDLGSHNTNRVSVITGLTLALPRYEAT